MGVEKKWFIKNKKADIKAIASNYGVSELICRLIVNRDIITEDEMNLFINPKLTNMHNAKNMKDLEKSVEILIEKIKTNQKIRIVGDFDVDGILSTYSLFRALKECGADVDYDIPDRIKDGYGINANIVETAKKQGIDTIITCDNGIAAIEPIEYAKKLEMTIIVTDHHDVPFIEDEIGNRTFITPNANAIVNPKQKDCNYSFSGLCGAGVVFKIIGELYKRLGIAEEELYDLIEFTAIATVCDVVDLVDENRIIVKHGLERLNHTSNKGLKALMKATGIEDKRISTYHLGFILGPCLNASGRLESAKKGLQLLLSENDEEAKELAEELVALNDERKKLTLEGVEKSIQIIETTELKSDKVYVIYIPEIHESIAGIVAGRIKEKYNKPTIILTKVENGAKGSARSIEGFNIFEELLKCKDLLSRFGGHPMAAGLSVEIEKIEILRRRLNENCLLTDEDFVPKITLDAVLPFNNISYDLVDELKMLEPFGKGNSKPIFGEKEIRILKGNILGQNQNVLKLKLLSKHGTFMDGIYFGDIEEFEQIIAQKYGHEELQNLYQGKNKEISVDIAFLPSINEYRGNKNLQVLIENFR